MITFENIDKTFADGTEAVKQLSVHIKEGEIFTLIGPSGCGKTTTMKMINRLITPTQGTIKIKNKDILSYDIHELRWNIGYVLQQIALFPHMTIKENIAIVPEMKNWNKRQIQARIEELLEMVGVDATTFLDRKPSELSGGQQQRVGVVRALAANPDIMLMDEPFSALDPITREQLQRDIQALQQQIQKTIVFVTHDMDEALAISDRICLMDEGTIVQVGTPKEIILNPKTDFVNSFIGDKRSAWQMTVEEALHVITLNELPDDQARYPIIDDNQLIVNAVELLQEKKVDKLLIKKDNKLIGAISETSILQFLREQISYRNGVIQ